MNPENRRSKSVKPSAPPDASAATAATVAAPASSPAIPFEPSDQKTAFTSIFTKLTADQLRQVMAWNRDHTYEEVAKLIHEKFGYKTSRTSVSRFYSRSAVIEHIEQTPEAEAAADEILRHSVDKDHKFTTATTRVLEQTAFKLSLTCHKNAEHFNQLERLSNLLTRQRHATVRERHAAVQETKCELRREQLALQREIATARMELENKRFSAKNPDYEEEYELSPSQKAFGDDDRFSNLGYLLSAPASCAVNLLDPYQPLDASTPEFFPFYFKPDPESIHPPETQRFIALQQVKVALGEIRHVHDAKNRMCDEYCNPHDKPFYEGSEDATFVPDPKRTRFLPPLKRTNPPTTPSTLDASEPSLSSPAPDGTPCAQLSTHTHSPSSGS